MRYKIGDVSRILGISTDLLRYYEKKGVVTPQKDKNNDYRYYDTGTLIFLLTVYGIKTSASAYRRLPIWLQSVTTVILCPCLKKSRAKLKPIYAGSSSCSGA